MTCTDLAKEHARQLAKHSSSAAERFQSLFLQVHPGWIYGPLPSMDQQTRELNRFWRLNLGMLSVNTFSERSSLINDIQPEYWLDNFERYVLPTVIENQLPNMPWVKTYN